MTIEYVVGDATAPRGSGPRVIVHVCNDRGGWGRGFVVALSRRWPEPEREYRAWFQRKTDPPFELGQVQLVRVEPDLWVANMIGQHGMSPKGKVPPVRYEAIRAGLTRIATFVAEHNASLHMPRIGCGLAGGEWAEVEKIISETACERGIAVTVYDLPQKQ